jgi:hypothetical protein
MGVIAKVSVGDIFYYQVDDVPTHTAPKGSVALMVSGSTYSNSFNYVNNEFCCIDGFWFNILQFF